MQGPKFHAGGKISCGWPLINCDMSGLYLQVSSYFVRLFSEPSSPEQCSHNAVVLVEALRDVGLDYDCQVRKGNTFRPVSSECGKCCTVHFWGLFCGQACEPKVPGFDPT